jgi:hypothetical protein
VHLHDGCDAQPQLVDQAGLEQRLGYRNAPVDPDLATVVLLELSREVGQAALDDSGLRPLGFQQRRGATNFWTPLMKLANGSMTLPGQNWAQSS